MSACHKNENKLKIKWGNDMKAKIINNYPFCPNCKEDIYIIDYKQVEFEGENYTEFICRCKKCKEIVTYLADVKMESTKRFVPNI